MNVVTVVEPGPDFIHHYIEREKERERERERKREANEEKNEHIRCLTNISSVIIWHKVFSLTSII